MTEPDDVSVCLDLMDERWPGYSNAKKIIRDEIVRLRKETLELTAEVYLGGMK